jgi:GrpB-like predicted nucleotidyltransferase (UPF0157 family)
MVAKRLQPLNVSFAFVGGAVMCLLVDNPGVMQFRRTKDVDVIVAAVTYIQFTDLEHKLRALGFQHDTSQGAPVCRWIVDGCLVDIMPQEPANLGMNTRWFPEALRLSVPKDFGEGCSAHVVTPALFLATKLEAFKDRGKQDFYASHDLEDIFTLVDGRADIVADVTGTDTAVKQFVIAGFKEIHSHAYFRDALVSHISEPLRQPIVQQRFEAVATL